MNINEISHKIKLDLQRFQGFSVRQYSVKTQPVQAANCSCIIFSGNIIYHQIVFSSLTNCFALLKYLRGRMSNTGKKTGDKVTIQAQKNGLLKVVATWQNLDGPQSNQ